MSAPPDDDRLGVRKPERETLLGFHDWYAQVVMNKVEGLTLEQASQPMTPSGISPLGIVKHLTWAEDTWFRFRFAGEDLDVEMGGDNSPTFVLDPEDTIESIVAAYSTAVQSSRRVVEQASLDDLAAREHRVYGMVSLRWIIVHMIEETARHAGHLDLMREQLDAQTGD